MPIKCCKDCVPPTRHPGCHAECSKYLKEKAKWEEQKSKAHKTVVLTKYDFNEIAYINPKRYKRHN